MLLKSKFDDLVAFVRAAAQDDAPVYFVCADGQSLSVVVLLAVMAATCDEHGVWIDGGAEETTTPHQLSKHSLRTRLVQIEAKLPHAHPSRFHLKMVRSSPRSLCFCFVFFSLAQKTFQKKIFGRRS